MIDIDITDTENEKQKKKLKDKYLLSIVCNRLTDDKLKELYYGSLRLYSKKPTQSRKETCDFIRNKCYSRNVTV